MTLCRRGRFVLVATLTRGLVAILFIGSSSKSNRTKRLRCPTPKFASSLWYGVANFGTGTLAFLPAQRRLASSCSWTAGLPRWDDHGGWFKVGLPTAACTVGLIGLVPVRKTASCRLPAAGGLSLHSP